MCVVLARKMEYYKIRSGSSDPPHEIEIEIENKTRGRGADGTIKDQDRPTWRSDSEVVPDSKLAPIQHLDSFEK